jgi:transposase
MEWRQLLKRYDAYMQEAHFLRGENRYLRADRDHYRREWFFTQQHLNDARESNARLLEENRRLKQQVKELTEKGRKQEEEAKASPQWAKASPQWVKASVRRVRRKRPGRKAGHAAALRPAPAHIDVKQDVPLPRDAAGRCSCPHCHARLLKVRRHKRVVEDIVPAKVVVTCYHTVSGLCPLCRRRVESRAPEQPPAANLPHGQLGLNALSTAILLRVAHRLPFRQVARVLSDLPGLRVSAAAVARQVQRAARWLSGDYERLLIELRASPHVHADETGWRTDGKNGYLWALTDPKHTLYHVDKSHSGAVIRNLLGRAFGGTLVSDFYSAYAKMDCRKQKCLLHLLRELAESARESAEFASGPFYPAVKRVIKGALRLKGRREELKKADYESRARRLERQVGELARADYQEPNERRIAKRMLKHESELTAFLWDRDLEGTNNAAERAIRPAVVARKISGGSRSKTGADAWAKLASLLRTATQQGQHVLQTIKDMLKTQWAAAP